MEEHSDINSPPPEGPGRVGGPRRVGLTQVLALAAVLVTVAGVAVAAFGLPGRSAVTTGMVPPAAAPPWREGPVACRRDPMAGVPNPTRFVVLAGCATVGGTVMQVRRDPADGEVNLLVAVDPRDAAFLPPGSQGLLRAAVVPRDVPRVAIPRVGTRARFYGAWVEDRNQRHQLAMHPVWGIEPPGGSAGTAARPVPRADRRLRVHLRAPRSVPVGGPIDVQVRVGSAGGGAERPLAEANLSFEVRGADGRGVQWKAATTNALGQARVILVALEHAGSYRLWLYVDKLGRWTVTSVPVTVRRR